MLIDQVFFMQYSSCSCNIYFGVRQCRCFSCKTYWSRLLLLAVMAFAQPTKWPFLYDFVQKMSSLFHSNEIELNCIKLFHIWLILVTCNLKYTFIYKSIPAFIFFDKKLHRIFWIKICKSFHRLQPASIISKKVLV